MGVRRLRRRAARAVLGLAVAWVMIGLGSGLAFGAGVGLLVAGVGLAAYLLLIYDVDEAPAVQDPGPAVVDVHPSRPLRTLRDMEQGGGDL